MVTQKQQRGALCKDVGFHCGFSVSLNMELTVVGEHPFGSITGPSEVSHWLWTLGFRLRWAWTNTSVVPHSSTVEANPSIHWLLDLDSHRVCRLLGLRDFLNR